MALKVVAEKEIPDQPQAAPVPTRPEQPQAAPRTERQSDESSTRFRLMVTVLEEIRRVLSARAAALLALTGALGLTAWAMMIQTPMALYTALSFDVLVYLPITAIAYWKPKG